MDESQFLERREQVRFALKAPASVRVPGRARVAARLLDLSRTGCRLVLGAQWPEGTGMWLQIAHLAPRFAQIMWAHERFAGVQFSVPLADVDFTDLLATFGSLTERDSAELRALSMECSRLSQGDTAGNTHMAQLAEACSAQAHRFDQDRHEQLQAILAARTQELLARLSVRSADLPGDNHATG
jgi:hypothetical protein